MRYNSNTHLNLLPQGVGAATRAAGFRRVTVADDFATADKISSRAPCNGRKEAHIRGGVAGRCLENNISADLKKAGQRMEAEAVLTHDPKNGYRLSFATNGQPASMTKASVGPQR
jgi:hypothetical protein